MGPSVERKLTVCSNGSMPLNKMATMHYMIKCLKIFFPRVKKVFKLNLGIQNRGFKALLNVLK